MSDPEIMKEVLAALPDTGAGARPRDLKLQYRGMISVRHALRELVAAGRARFEGPDMQRRYWRIPQTLTQASGSSPSAEERRMVSPPSTGQLPRSVSAKSPLATSGGDTIPTVVK